MKATARSLKKSTSGGITARMIPWAAAEILPAKVLVQRTWNSSSVVSALLKMPAKIIMAQRISNVRRLIKNIQINAPQFILVTRLLVSAMSIWVPKFTWSGFRTRFPQPSILEGNVKISSKAPGQKHISPDELQLEGMRGQGRIDNIFAHLPQKPISRLDYNHKKTT